MPQGKAISEAVQWIIICLSIKMSAYEIAMYTDIGKRKVQEILAHFQKTGSVGVPKHEKVAHLKSLRDEEIQHLYKPLSSTPDLYLDELHQELEETHGILVLLSVIWRTLRKGGYTMKKLEHVAIKCSAEKWASFAAHIGTYNANQLVFVDESAVD